jgi:hypothetical protein
MKQPVNLFVILFIALFLIISGCNREIESTSKDGKISQTPNSSFVPTSYPITPTQTEHTVSATPIYSPALTATSTLLPEPATRTPQPTLPPEQSQSRLFELLDTNGGCRLPCWWGITPGKTTWEEAWQILSPFTRLTGISGSNDQYFFASLRIPFPDDVGTTDHTYLVKDGIVEEIEVYNWNYATRYYLPEFINTYGQPDEVWIRTEQPGARGLGPFELVLFYPSQGIMMNTPGGSGEIIEGNILRNCLKDMNWPFLYLWPPDRQITFPEAEKLYFSYPGSGYFLPLYEATGITVEEFYESFKNSEHTTCLETSLDLWP